MTVKQNCYILTGGPGVGKTSLIDELKDRGYTTIREVAREIIKEQLVTNGAALPWQNRNVYSKLMLERSISDYIEIKNLNEIIFFDRGIPDTLAYNNLIGLETDSELYNMALDCRYSSRVFLLPPWKEIYHTDNERKQDFKEAIDTYNVIKETYLKLNYDIIEVPKASIKNRADFIISHCISSKY